MTRRQQLEEDLHSVFESAIKKLERSPGEINLEDLKPVLSKFDEINHKCSILEKMMNELSPECYEDKFIEVKNRVDKANKAINALHEKYKRQELSANLEFEVENIYENLTNDKLNYTPEQIQILKENLDDLTSKARHFYSDKYMIMPKPLASKIADCNQILAEKIVDITSKKLAVERNLTRLRTQIEGIDYLLDPFEALVSCHGILNRLDDFKSLGIDQNSIDGVTERIFAKIKELEAQLGENDQNKILIPEYMEKLAAVKSVIKHTEKLDILQLDHTQLAELSKLLSEHIKLTKIMRKQLPVLLDLKTNNIIETSPAITDSELEAYEYRLSGLKSQIILPPLLIITSPDGEQIMPSLWKIEGMNENLSENISDWARVSNLDDLHLLSQNSAENIANTKSLLTDIESSIEFKPSLSNRATSTKLMMDLGQQLDDLTLVSQPVLLQIYRKPVLWKRLQAGIEELRRRISLFEEQLEHLPEQTIEENDPRKDPKLLLDNLRKRWLTFDRMMVYDSTSPIESMLIEVNSMVEEGEYIEKLLQNTSAISRLPLLDKHFRLISLMKKLRHKLEKTNENMKNNSLTVTNQNIYSEFENVVSRLDGKEFNLPLRVDSVAELDVLITKFKLNYDSFIEIYEKLLESDYDELSSLSRVDHIKVFFVLTQT